MHTFGETSSPSFRTFSPSACLRLQSLPPRAGHGRDGPRRSSSSRPSSSTTGAKNTTDSIKTLENTTDSIKTPKNTTDSIKTPKNLALSGTSDRLAPGPCSRCGSSCPARPSPGACAACSPRPRAHSSTPSRASRACRGVPGRCFRAF